MPTQLNLFNEREIYKKEILNYIEKKQNKYINLKEKDKENKTIYNEIIVTLTEVFYEINCDLIY